MFVNYLAHFDAAHAKSTGIHQNLLAATSNSDVYTSAMCGKISASKKKAKSGKKNKMEMCAAPSSINPINPEVKQKYSSKTYHRRNGKAIDAEHVCECGITFTLRKNLLRHQIGRAHV